MFEYTEAQEAAELRSAKWAQRFCKENRIDGADGRYKIYKEQGGTDL